MIDELTPIARYMAAEMSSNAAGADAREMLRLNQTSAERCIAEYNKLPLWMRLLGLGLTPGQCVNIDITNRQAALIAWALKVRQNGDWDHKPKIAAQFHPRNPTGPQHWHLHDKTLYFYDVWSNIHYGYVGRAAGFSDSVLLDGAGLEQIGSDALRGSLAQCRGALEDGLRACDAASDRAAIVIGLRLFGDGPVTPERLLQAVLRSPDITRKPYVAPAR